MRLTSLSPFPRLTLTQARGGPDHRRMRRRYANLRRLCGHDAYVASGAFLREIPEDRPDDGHITSRPPATECGLAMLRLSENVLVTTPDPDRIGLRPPAFPGNR